MKSIRRNEDKVSLMELMCIKSDCLYTTVRQNIDYFKKYMRTAYFVFNSYLRV